MSKICRFTVPASRDLETILDYIAEQSSIDRAEAFLKQINAALLCKVLSPDPIPSHGSQARWVSRRGEKLTYRRSLDFLSFD